MRTVSVKSAARILDVLELASTLRQGIGVNELGRRLNIPKSSASSLVSTLEGRGYLQADADGYRLADCYRESGWVGGNNAELLRHSRPVMQRLTLATGESCFLGVVTPSLDVQYADKVISDNPLRYDGDLSFTRPAYCTSIGWVILGGMSDAALDEYLASRELVAVTPKTVTDPSKIKRAVRESRTRGCATIADSHVLGASGAAAPIVRGGRVIAGVAVIAPTERFNRQPDQIVHAVKSAAREISQALQR